MNSWVPLIATSVGVTLGALLAFISQWVQFRRQRTTEARNISLSKLEELYEVLTEIRQRYTEGHGEQTSRLILPKKPRTQSSSSAEKGPIPFGRMEMLVTIYAPSLQGEVDSIMALRAEIGKIIVEAISADDQPRNQRKELLGRTSAAHVRMNATINQARSNVAKLAATLVD